MSFSIQPLVHKTAALCLTDHCHKMLCVNLHFQNITSREHCQLLMHISLKSFYLLNNFTLHGSDISGLTPEAFLILKDKVKMSIFKFQHCLLKYMFSDNCSLYLQLQSFPKVKSSSLTLKPSP